MGIPEGYKTRRRLLVERINAAGRQVDGRLGTFAQYNINMRRVLISVAGERAITSIMDWRSCTASTRLVQVGPGWFTPIRGTDLNHGVHAMVRPLRFGRTSDRWRYGSPSFSNGSLHKYSDERRPSETNITFNSIHYVTVARSFVDTMLSI